MPFDGSGNFNRVHDWTADEGAGIKVRADRFDAENDDFATGFENCITRDGQGKPSANLDFNNKKITNLADPTTLTGALNVRTAQQNTYSFGTTAGSVNVYTLALGITVASLVDGQPFRAEIHITNTGSSTLNVDSFGAKTIKLEGQDLVAGELQANSIYTFAYNAGTGFIDLQKTLLKDATESVKGVVELATSAETITGTDTTRATHPKGVADAINNKVVLLGDLSGLRTEQDTDTDHDIKINTGTALDSGKDTIIRLSSALVKRIDANWTAGTNQGGFPSGLSLTADTWYHYFLIYNPTSDTTDAGWDTSLSATNLLSDATGYTKYRRIWSHLTDGSSNIRDYYQRKNWNYWKDITVDFNGSFGTTATLVTLLVPLGVDCLVKFIGFSVRAGASNDLLLTSPYQTDVAATTNIVNIKNPVSQAIEFQNMQILTNTSSQIRGRASQNSSSVIIDTYAYKDFLEN